MLYKAKVYPENPNKLAMTKILASEKDLKSFIKYECDNKEKLGWRDIMIFEGREKSKKDHSITFYYVQVITGYQKNEK